MNTKQLKNYLKTKPNFFPKKITQLDLTLLFRQLATLITAGIPITQSCDILVKTHEKILLQTLLRSIKNLLESGKTLAQSLRQYPNYFDELIYHLIHIGEQTGTLDVMLVRIANHQEKKRQLNQRIKQILFYPILIFLFALIISVSMLIWIVPRFAELFQHFHDKLPLITRGIIFISHSLRENTSIIFLILLSVATILYRIKQTKQFQYSFNQFTMKLPYVGNLIKKILLARFAHTLAMTFAAGVPILDALKMMTHLSHHPSYIKTITKLQTDIARGQQLHLAMQTQSLFPTIMIQMVKVGEESGKLEEMLEKMAHLYESDINQMIANLSQLLEPLIMMILGVLIGGLVIAMYLPIFKLGSIV